VKTKCSEIWREIRRERGERLRDGGKILRETIKGMRVYSFCPSLSLLFYLVSCMSAVEANKVCLAVLRANSSMDMLDYRGQTALLKKTFV
jgi:hypothetical protein